MSTNQPIPFIKCPLSAKYSSSLFHYSTISPFHLLFVYFTCFFGLSFPPISFPFDSIGCCLSLFVSPSWIFPFPSASPPRLTYTYIVVSKMTKEREEKWYWTNLLFRGNLCHWSFSRDNSAPISRIYVGTYAEHSEIPNIPGRGRKPGQLLFRGGHMFPPKPRIKPT